MYNDSIETEAFNWEGNESLVKETFDFLGINPEWFGLDVAESLEFSASSLIDQCDIAGLGFDQLTNLGLDDNQVFMLSLNHAGIHHVLNCMSDFSEWSEVQKEYTENFMTGVSAAIHEIDLSQLETMRDSAYINDINAIHEGIQFTQDYIDKYGSLPTFEDCQKHIEETSHHNNVSFKGSSESDVNRHYIHARNEYERARADYDHYMDMARHHGSDYDDMVNAREALRRMDETSHEMYKWDHMHQHMHAGSADVYSQNNSNTDTPDHSNVNFKGYSKDEIARKLSNAESEHRRYEGLVEHHKYMAKHGLDKADTEYHLNKVKEFQNRANEYAAEANKWRYTKPDKK